MKKRRHQGLRMVNGFKDIAKKMSNADGDKEKLKEGKSEGEIEKMRPEAEKC